MNLPAAFMEVCEQHGHTLTEHCLHVKVAAQTLTHYHGDQSNTLTASTAVNGTGQQAGSLQTPLGLHRVCEKIGDNEPVGTVFKGRQPKRRDGKGVPRVPQGAQEQQRGRRRGVGRRAESRVERAAHQTGGAARWRERKGAEGFAAGVAREGKVYYIRDERREIQ